MFYLILWHVYVCFIHYFKMNFKYLNKILVLILAFVIIQNKCSNSDIVILLCRSTKMLVLCLPNLALTSSLPLHHNFYTKIFTPKSQPPSLHIALKAD